MKGQKLKAPSMKNATVFDRNLEEALDARRAGQNLATIHTWQYATDFSSNDFLSLSTNGLLRTEFLEELARNPNFQLGSTGSRLSDGNSSYIEDLEKEIAEFHGAESALMVNSGYDANGAIFCAIPRPGDVIVYDELIHASAHDGMKHSLTQKQLPFRHNDPECLRDVLTDLEDSNPLIRKGQRCVLIAVESVYSMDGDVCPLKELVEVAKEIFPKGNAQFLVDEAHSTGLMGEQGRGLVSSLGLEKIIAVRLHTYGKGMSATGAAILTNQTVRNMLLNFARPIIYTTAPSFPMLAAIRAAYTLLKTGKTEPLQQRVQHLVKHFYKAINSNPHWNDITKAGVCTIPLSEDWETRDFITQFVPVWTREKYNYYLTIHLQGDRFRAIPISPPVVPRGTGRVRIVMHAGNTEVEVEALAASICRWAKEMYDIEKDTSGIKLPSAMHQMYELMSAADMKITAPSASSGNPFLE
ncbi:PLP-dependent transferase [Hyaloscypha hepaticicola]|uniref:PLP-dependent transferase n=1 Tax=Hyaloscypha hepaticicola TaxID=2082293 RepID=A0A2J6PH42_9HELO|nr:PLP-dependent transferase [Hyaloscypha hepaticicola]